MPIIRKIVSFGKTSKGIILPKSWLEYFEKTNGQKIKEVTIEVNGQLIIQPLLQDSIKTQPRNLVG